MLRARPLGLSIEGANPRHGHEWQVWQDVTLPDGKALIPGVLDTTTNFIEHPELIAQRILNYANVVGRENVIAGSDCGFGTSAWGRKVEASIAWAKLASMAEGATAGYAGAVVDRECRDERRRRAAGRVVSSDPVARFAG